MTDNTKRTQQLLTALSATESLSVEQTCKLLHISPATTRRLFITLENEGLVERFWGGIRLPFVPENREQSVAIRKNKLLEEKKAIAAAAAQLVADGEVVIIDGGTTTVCMVPHLVDREVKIITNSILIAYEFDRLRSKESKGAEVLLTGGMLYRELGLLVGLQARNNLKEYHADKVFISVGALDAEFATNHNQPVVDCEQVMIAQSKSLILLADHSKLGKIQMCKICPTNRANIIITNQQETSDIFFSQPTFEGIQIIKA